MFFNCCGCCSPSLEDAFYRRTALITGASAGLGVEFARQLAPHVATLILVARRVDRLEALRSELARPGLEIQCHAVDLADRAALEAFLAALAKSTPTVDVLINNAGLGDHGFFESSDWTRVDQMLEVNIRALTCITHALVPSLVRARRGAILNVSSVAGFVPVPQMAVYAATKSYVTSFSEGLRAELRGTNVRVTTLCPGPVETEFSGKAARPGEIDSMQSPSFLRVPAARVVREGLQALAADRGRVIGGWRIWAMFTALSFIPFFLVRLALSQRLRRPELTRRRGF